MLKFKSTNILTVLALSLLTVACTNPQNNSAVEPLKEVLTKEKQDVLTPEAVIEA